MIETVLFYSEPELIELLLQGGAKVDQQDNQDYSALMYAAINGSDEIVRSLLAHGANVRLTNYQGKTAFELAEDLDNEDIVTLLRAVKRLLPTK